MREALRISQDIKTVTEKDKSRKKMALAMMGIGLAISLAGIAGVDGVRQERYRIKQDFPQNPQLWQQMEEQKHLLQEERKSNIILIVGLGGLLTGFGMIINQPEENQE